MSKRHRSPLIPPPKPAPPAPGELEAKQATAAAQLRQARAEQCLAELEMALRGILTKHRCALLVEAGISWPSGEQLTVSTGNFRFLTRANDIEAPAAPPPPAGS